MQHEEGSVPGMMHITTSNVTCGDVSSATVTNSSGSGYSISGSQSDCISSINVQNTVTNLPLSVSDNNKDNMSISLQQVLPLGSTISDSLKNRIWSNEFVDLGLLLPTIHNKAQALPLVVQVLRDLLYNCNYDVVETEYLLDRFSKGFSLFYEKTSFQMDCKNLKLALEKPDVVSDKLCRELKAKRIAGPFLDRPCKYFNVSPLGLCPKKEKGKFWLIFHLSYPQAKVIQ